jgi:RNA polymerase sigma-B factor
VRSRAESDRLLFGRLADPRDPLDEAALVERFLPLARSVAARYAGGVEPFDDIFQVACMALVKAINRYDVDRGRAFSSYAVPTIAGEIKRYYRDRTWIIHVPRDVQEMTLALERARETLETELARAPTVEELARHLGILAEDVLEARHAEYARYTDSLDAPWDDEDDGATRSDRMGIDEPGFAAAEQRADIGLLSRVLPQRSRDILRLRFELELTQDEIGREVGLSQMQVSRILRTSLELLRHHADHRAARAA